ncbi:hypothetical protein [Stella sp.]|uniref:hypothetical protein n=1 Tax=Stella sp. TaxID=2912054 RepID=UPI0035B4B230
MPLENDETRKRRARNRALLAVLAGLAILFYLVTVVRMREADRSAHDAPAGTAAPERPATPPRP